MIGEGDEDVFTADFGSTVVFNGQTFKGNKDAPSELIGGGNVVSTEHTLLVKSSDVASMKPGDNLTVDGAQFRCRSVRAIDDGAFSFVVMGKV